MPLCAACVRMKRGEQSAQPGSNGIAAGCVRVVAAGYSVPGRIRPYADSNLAGYLFDELFYFLFCLFRIGLYFNFRIVLLCCRNSRFLISRGVVPFDFCYRLFHCCGVVLFDFCCRLFRCCGVVPFDFCCHLFRCCGVIRFDFFRHLFRCCGVTRFDFFRHLFRCCGVIRFDFFRYLFRSSAVICCAAFAFRATFAGIIIRRFRNGIQRSGGGIRACRKSVKTSCGGFFFLPQSLLNILCRRASLVVLIESVCIIHQRGKINPAPLLADIRPVLGSQLNLDFALVCQ